MFGVYSKHESKARRFGKCAERVRTRIPACRSDASLPSRLKLSTNFSISKEKNLRRYQKRSSRDIYDRCKRRNQRGNLSLIFCTSSLRTCEQIIQIKRLRRMHSSTLFQIDIWDREVLFKPSKIISSWRAAQHCVCICVTRSMLGRTTTRLQLASATQKINLNEHKATNCSERCLIMQTCKDMNSDIFLSVPRATPRPSRNCTRMHIPIFHVDHFEPTNISNLLFSKKYFSLDSLLKSHSESRSQTVRGINRSTQIYSHRLRGLQRDTRARGSSSSASLINLYTRLLARCLIKRKHSFCTTIISSRRADLDASIRG
ncbi:unnamed protein product [Trichogramma brassicae]|uniref:Uncharacterized protein n=1 Tax=Trichogramma brassicae TaxID=86971 RepID=A0A6H5IMP5_9HYME|nr:unnamed protein product [Trichogramma brassicae]